MNFWITHGKLLNFRNSLVWIKPTCQCKCNEFIFQIPFILTYFFDTGNIIIPAAVLTAVGSLLGYQVSNKQTSTNINEMNTGSSNPSNSYGI